MSDANSPRPARDIPLELVIPDFSDPLTDTILQLQSLKTKELNGPFPARIFFQLKFIFQFLESLGSARIEGNKTTLNEFVEKVIDGSARISEDEKTKEITNIEKAIDFIESNVTSGTPITAALLSEAHKIIVKDLTPPSNGGEGSESPGEYRKRNVQISRSNHVPPDYTRMDEFMEQLLDFVNQKVEPKYDLLITAIAHHRMAWIHPFDNGNGRIIRIFTYALLIKQGFRVKEGRILNPTAIFCMDRDKYYEMLALADSGDKGKIIEWCTYVLEGLLIEIEKIDKLLNPTYLVNKLLLPALVFARDHKHISKREYDILRVVVTTPHMSARARDLEDLLGKFHPTYRSRIIKSLRDKNLLTPIKGGGREYTVGFENNYLLRGIIEILGKEKFIPSSMNRNTSLPPV